MNKIKNPLSVFQVVKSVETIIRQFNGSTVQRFNSSAGIYHSISLTGGEPLLQAEFLKELIPQLKRLGLKIYLETNGTLPDALKSIIKDIDIIAMDIKLPSALRQAQGRGFWKEHKEFLKICNTKLKKSEPVPTFIKIVVTPKTKKKEIEIASELISAVNRNIPLVLQPVSKKGTVPPLVCDKQTGGQSLFYYQKIAGAILRDVRIIPQLHKIINIP